MYSWRKDWIYVFDVWNVKVHRKDGHVWRGKKRSRCSFFLLASLFTTSRPRFTTTTRGFCSSRFYMINYARFFPYQSPRYNARAREPFVPSSVCECRWRNSGGRRRGETSDNKKKAQWVAPLRCVPFWCYARFRSILSLLNLSFFYSDRII